MGTTITAYHLNEAYEAKINIESANGVYTIKLNIDQQEVIGKGVTLFDALIQIRLIIEPAGWLLGINASRVDAGNIISKKGNYDDKVTIVSENKTQIIPALDSAPKDFIANIALQRNTFNSKYDDFIKHEELVSKNKEAIKEIKYTKSSRVRDITGPSGTMTAIIVAISVFYPFGIYQLLFSPTSRSSGFVSETSGTGSTSVAELTTWLLLAGICLYGIAIAVAVEHVAKGKGSGVFVFAAVSLPILSAIFSTYFAIAEVSKIVSENMTPW